MAKRGAKTNGVAEFSCAVAREIDTTTPNEICLTTSGFWIQAGVLFLTAIRRFQELSS